MDEARFKDWVLLGKVIKPHGLEGALRIHSYAGSEQAFLDAPRVFFRLKTGRFCTHEVVSVTAHKRVFLMRVSDVSTLQEAERYRGAEIFVSREALGGTQEGEYFWQDLLGLEVCLDTGEPLGRVSRILSTRAHDIYIVSREKGEVLVPATWEVVKEIDLEGGRMIISPMEGLLDLNEI